MWSTTYHTKTIKSSNWGCNTLCGMLHSMEEMDSVNDPYPSANK